MAQPAANTWKNPTSPQSAKEDVKRRAEAVLPDATTTTPAESQANHKPLKLRPGRDTRKASRDGFGSYRCVVNDRSNRDWPRANQVLLKLADQLVNSNKTTAVAG